MIKRLLIGLAFMCALVSCNTTARIAKADKKFALGEYYRAGEMYRAIYPNISPRKDKKQKAEVAFKMGNSYRLIESNKRAETALKNAIRYKYKDSIVYYYYAEVLRRNGKYPLAQKQYEEYLKSYPTSLVALNGLASCDSALHSWEKQSRYEVAKPKVFQSKFSEFCPVFSSSRGDVLYFNSTRGGKKTKVSRITGQRNNDIFYSRKNVQGEWEKPLLLEHELNTDFDEGAVAFSADGQEMYYTCSKVVKGETLGASILMTQRSGGNWSEVQPVHLVKDSTISVAHPALSPDDQYLYFVSDMPGGYGGKDIWRVTKGEGGTWGAPENLGPDINTEAEEMFPSFRADGTLFFSSNGHPGLGGLDLFAATLKEDKQGQLHWKVQRLPAPINSRSDDYGITFEGETNNGFFSSNRGNSRFYDHIYQFYQPELNFTLTGKIVDEKGNGLGDARVKIVGNDGTIATIRPKKDGSYSYELSPETQYVLMGACRGFLNHKAEVKVPYLEKSKDFPMDFTLSSVTRPVKMENIFYLFGSAELTPESSKGLDELVKLLNDNPNITIEIGAHTDYVGSDGANQELSEQRAQSVVNYLTAKGIEAERLTAKGYGETTPVVPDRAMVVEHRFLKIDQPLTQEFIAKLNKEEQEIANAINRRTEFKVLKTTYKLY